MVDENQEQGSAPAPSPRFGGGGFGGGGFGGGFGGPRSGGGPGGPRSGGGARPRRRPGGGGRGAPRRKICAFCADNVDYVDYKDASRLRRYLNERAKVEARRKFGTCAKHQRALATAIKRARHVGLLPFTSHHTRS